MKTISLVKDFSYLHEHARTHPEGRSSTSLHEGESCVLRQTVTALCAGHSMKVEHPPVEGWIFIIDGHVQLQVFDSLKFLVDAPIGTLMQLPRESLELTARDDSLLLLTVAMGDRPRSPHDVTQVNESLHEAESTLDDFEYAREVWDDESPVQGERLKHAEK